MAWDLRRHYFRYISVHLVTTKTSITNNLPVTGCNELRWVCHLFVTRTPPRRGRPVHRGGATPLTRNEIDSQSLRRRTPRRLSSPANKKNPSAGMAGPASLSERSSGLAMRGLSVNAPRSMARCQFAKNHQCRYSEFRVSSIGPISTNPPNTMYGTSS